MRHHATEEGDVPFTAEEESEWDAAEYAAAHQAPAVPENINRLQARLYLLSIGKWNLIQPAINTLSDPDKSIAQAYFDDAPEWHRNNQFVLTIGSAIGLDSAGLDTAFIAAKLM